MILFLVILWNLIIPLTLSYFIFKIIYRKVFKSQKKISKFLVFIGGITLSSFHIFNISYYFQPSYWEFKEICKLDEEIYQANGGKIDEEYYNKILGYYKLNLDTLDYSKFQETTTLNFQQQEPPYKKMKVADKNLYLYYPLAILYKSDISDRISLGTGIIFNNDKPKNKQDVESVSTSPEWQTYQISDIYWNISTSGDFRMPTEILYCDYFKYDHSGTN